MSEEGLIVAVDFDGTIVESNYPEVGSPKEYAVNALKRLKNKGIRIVVWTCRVDLEPVREFLDHYDIEVDAINSNDALTEEEWDKFNNQEGAKKSADIYIDDRNLISAVDKLTWAGVASRLEGIYNRRVNHKEDI